MTPSSRIDTIAAPASATTPRTILVVDDEADSVDLMCAILESRGFLALAASSGRAALRQIAERTPDLVLLDVMMPQMSGLQVLDHLRRAPMTARLPIILITAKRQDDDMIRGYQLGADYYITKPCTAAQLMYGLDLVFSGRHRPPAQAPGDPAQRSRTGS